MIQWDQWAVTAATTIGGVLTFLWKQKRTAKREQEARFQSLKEEQDRRHDQNQQKLNSILTEQRYLEPHFHNESEGPLLAGGIRRRPRNGPGS